MTPFFVAALHCIFIRIFSLIEREIMAPMERDGTVVNTLLVALLEPHTGHLLLPFINYTLVILLIVLVATFASGVHSIHLVVLGFLALGLMVSINW